MSVWPFITCHSCRRAVRPPERAALDLAGQPHHSKCLSIRGLPLTALRAAEPSVGAETCALTGVSSLLDSPRGAGSSGPRGAFSQGGR